MSNKLFIAFVAMLLVLPSAFALSTTVIDGVVYSGANIQTPVVSGVKVDVTCNNALLSSTSDSAGKWRVIYSDNVCPIGSNATACVGSNCQSSKITSSVSKFNLLEVQLFDVPEYGTIAASAGLIGLSVGYFYIRKNKK